MSWLCGHYTRLGTLAQTFGRPEYAFAFRLSTSLKGGFPPLDNTATSNSFLTFFRFEVRRFCSTLDIWRLRHPKLIPLAGINKTLADSTTLSLCLHWLPHCGLDISHIATLINVAGLAKNMG